MNIYVNGKIAVLKSGFSFDYVSENRLFLGRDGYTFNITFPLSDCPRNIEIFGHLNRIDVSKNTVAFECSIRDKDVLLNGILAVVKVSDSEIECQFSEGRCAQTVLDPFENVFVSDLNLGKPAITDPELISPTEAWQGFDTGTEEVALPWINGNSPEFTQNNAFWSTNVTDWHWAPDVESLSWQPFLIVLARRICNAVGYSCNFSEWESSPLRHLLVCNTLPAAMNMHDYANVLPQWTVSEFFEKLETFMMCEFDFDHKAKSVGMRFSKNAINEIEPVRLDNIVDSYSAAISQNNNNTCDYIATKRFAYKACEHEMWNYYSCDWYIQSCTVRKSYPTIAELIERNQPRYSGEGESATVQYGELMYVGANTRMSTVNALLYAEDVDTFFVFRSIGTSPLSSIDSTRFAQNYVLQPVNVFGSGSTDESNTEELEFVPVCISGPLDRSGNSIMSLYPSVDESELADDEPVFDMDYNPADIKQPIPATCILNGEPERKSAYYEEIYLGYWPGLLVNAKSPAPSVDGLTVHPSWHQYSATPQFCMRLAGRFRSPEYPSASQLPQIDPTRKFNFSWLGNVIPDPRAIFYIRGKRYLCEKITATFTENGMSQLLKGEFYPILEED